MWGDIELTADSTVAQPEQSPPNTGISSIRHVAVSLHMGTLGSLSALPLGTILNSEIANKKHKNGEVWH